MLLVRYRDAKALVLECRHDAVLSAGTAKKHPRDLVVMEACGPCGWICDLCQELGIDTLVCSTNEEAWKWKNVKSKTDRDDALKLARLARMGELKPVDVPKWTVREHRSLVLPVGTNRSARQDYQTRFPAIADDAAGVRLGQLALQPVGQAHL